MIPPREWRVELMNDAGLIETLLFEGYDHQDELNEYALTSTRERTGDPTWRTLHIRDETMGAAALGAAGWGRQRIA